MFKYLVVFILFSSICYSEDRFVLTNDFFGNGYMYLVREIDVLEEKSFIPETEFDEAQFRYSKTTPKRLLPGETCLYDIPNKSILIQVYERDDYPDVVLTPPELKDMLNEKPKSGDGIYWAVYKHKKNPIYIGTGSGYAEYKTAVYVLDINGNLGVLIPGVSGIKDINNFSNWSDIVVKGERVRTKDVLKRWSIPAE